MFRWSQEAEELIADHLRARNRQQRTTNAPASLATRLVVLTGNPREACLRFLHRHGITQKRGWRPWTKVEQQRLFDLLETHTVEEVAQSLQRSPNSVRSMLHRLGESAQRGRDWFTPYSLAAALHIRVEEIQKWITRGWLKCRTVETTGIKKRIIDPDDFCDFVKRYGPEVVGRRLTAEGLWFVQSFVFPPKHAHLLPLRKKQDDAQTSTTSESEKPDALEDTA
ncbi:MAG TPA: hypothetical protein VFR24_04760 [Candidatus Angelobacter sp.]|nr:hypothetical protein [Candidatus Angelobacter sp.]